VNSFEPLIRQWADTYGVPAHVVAGVMMRESQGVQGALAPDGGVGLMQLTTSSVKEGHSNEELLSDASLNIQLGAKALGSLWSKYGGNPIDAITAYNAGGPRCGGANPWNLINTQDYVGGVLAFANGAFDGAFGPKALSAGVGTFGIGALLIAAGGALGWYGWQQWRHAR